MTKSKNPTSNDCYRELINAIAKKAVGTVTKLCKNPQIKDFINADPRGYDNLPPLMQALCPRDGQINLAILKALLSIKEINVQVRQRDTNKSVLDLLNERHLDPDDQTALEGLLSARGLTIPLKALPIVTPVAAVGLTTAVALTTDPVETAVEEKTEEVETAVKEKEDDDVSLDDWSVVSIINGIPVDTIATSMSATSAVQQPPPSLLQQSLAWLHFSTPNPTV